MDIDFLAAQGFSLQTITNWKAHRRATLLPLQAQAVTRTRLLSDGNLVVFAPTSSGKTFVAELAALRQFDHGMKSIFLVPTKSLAEEQFRHLQHTYEALDARVVIATRERTLYDSRILRGDFDFAVMVYEKLKAFLTAAPELLSRIALVAVDELQILGETGRGDVVDLLLTQIVQAQPKIQVVALSAVLREHQRLANWLRAEPLIWTQRPTELREGVFCLSDSHYHYNESNSGTEASEALLQTEDDSGRSWSILSDPASFQYPAVEVLTSQFVQSGEQVLIFVPTRDLTRTWAYRLANRLPPPPRDLETNTAMEEAEHSHSRELMERCLENGVGFHNADLGADLRRLIEERFQSGEIRVLIATSTLAQGVNLNCRNVIHVPVMLDPCVTSVSAKPAFVPLSVQRFRNQGGRAGRLCSSEPFGRSIVIAEDEAELRRLMNHYVRAEVEPLETKLGKATMDRLCLDLVHSGRAPGEQLLADALMETYSGAAHWTVQQTELQSAVHLCVQRLVDAKLVQRNVAADRLTVTGLGQIAAAYGLHANTMRLFAHYCAGAHDCSELEVLSICAFCADGAVFPVTVSSREAMEQFFPRLLKMRYGSLIYALPDALRSLLAPDGGFSNPAMCALKKIFLADAWISAAATHEIEEQYRTFAGTFANLGTHFSWLAQALAACFGTLGGERAQVEQVSELAERLAWGTSPAGLHVARLGVAGVTRTDVQQLVRAGLESVSAVAECELDQLQQVLPARVAAELISEARRVRSNAEDKKGQNWFSLVHGLSMQKQESAEQQEPAHSIEAESESHYRVEAPELVLDSRSPGEIQFRGERIKLTPKPFELLCLLAKNPGRTVPYAEIDAALWPDSKVEAQQRSAHKVALVQALAEVCSREEIEKLIVSVPRFGVRLEVPEERISFGKIRTAARTKEGKQIYATAT